MSSQRMRRGAGFFAAACAASALVVPSALADPVDKTQPAASSVQANADTTLTIHKCEQSDTNGTTAGTGNQQPPADCTPVNDVEFKITELDYDLTTQKGWESLAKAGGDVNKALTQDIDGDTDHKTTTNVVHVTAAGLATFSNAETAAGKAYLVSETKTPAGVIPAADFIVTLPMTNPDDPSQWNYDVHVYPKNSVNGVKKEVVDNAAKSGSNNALTYTVTTDIPKVGSEGIKKYQVIDALDGRIQTGTGPDQLNPKVMIDNLPGGQAQLTDGDYTITIKPNATPGEDKHNYLTVDFTPAGLQKLAAARAAGTMATKVKVELTATFAEGTNLDGGISNVASLIPSDSPNFTWDKDNPNPGPNPGDPKNPIVPGTNTDPVVSKYGEVELTKTGTDAKDAATYNGAQFQVYECSIATDDAALDAGKITTKVGTNPVLLHDVDATLKGQPLSVGNETTFETGKATAVQNKAGVVATAGKVVIGSLRANDWENGQAKVLDKDNWYCLVETKAPTGYSLAPDPIPFRILGDDALNTATDTLVTVTDVPKNAGFHLPLTGASGVVFLTVVGGVLVLAGAGIAYANKRRQNH